MVYKNILIPIEDAISRYGRPSDGRGGKAELARRCGIQGQALYRWAGPYIPGRHVQKLIKRDHGLIELAVKVSRN